MPEPSLKVDDFIRELGDRNDVEIAGLTDALRAAVAHFTRHQRLAFETELPAILERAKKTRF
jgi:hypothetical protein